MYSLTRKQQPTETGNSSNYDKKLSAGVSTNNASSEMPTDASRRTSTSMGSRFLSSAKRAIAAPTSPKQSIGRKATFKPPLDYNNSYVPPGPQEETPSFRTIKATKSEESGPFPVRTAKQSSASNRLVSSSSNHSRSNDPTVQSSSASTNLRIKDTALRARPKQVSDPSQPHKGEKRKVIRKKLVTRKAPALPDDTSSQFGSPSLSTKQHSFRHHPTIAKENSETIERRISRKSLSKHSYDEQRLESQKSNHQDGNQQIHSQVEINEMEAKHAEEMYWMKLELNTVRKSKEAVEDRIAELYRDVQDVLQPNTENGGSQGFGDDSILNNEDSAGMVTVKSDTIANMQNQLDKYERMLRIMKHQTDLIKNSSESVVTSLKEEISNLMEEKTRTEMNLMNKLAEVHREKRDLTDQLIHFQQKARKDQENNEANEELEQVRFNLKLVKAENKRLREQLQLAATRITSTREDDSHSNTMNDDNDEFKDQQRQQIDLLQSTNVQLTESIQNARQTALVNLKKWNKDKIALQEQIKQLSQEVTSLQSLGGSAELIQALQKEKNNYSDTLDRVSLLTKNANEIVKNLEHMMSDFKGSQEGDSTPVSPRKSIVQGTDRDRCFSFMEKALLVQGDVKMSLMLIELKCRNGLLAIKNIEQGSGDRPMEGLLRSDSFTTTEQRQKIMSNALDAIRLLEEKVNGDIESLQSQSRSESERVKQSMEEKVSELKKMMSKQANLEEEIIQLKQNGTGGLPSSSNQDAANASSLELFVSRKALETLQTEVLIVVSRVNEQNETIARLRSEIEEHRIRERTLMSELKRNINDQFSRQVHDYAGASDDDEGHNEHNNPASDQLPLFYASGGEEYPESENEFSEDEDNVSYEEVEYEEDEEGQSCGSDEYEEYTVYDEQTVVEDAPAAKEKARRGNDTIAEEAVVDDDVDDGFEDETVIEDYERRNSM